MSCPQTKSGAHKVYAINRVEKPGHSVQFIVQVRRRMEIKTRTFSVTVWGSEQKALQAAVLWRDEALRRMEPMLRSVYASQVRPNNTSGVPGVVRCVIGGKRYWRACAPNSPETRRRSKAFNIERHGDEEAFRLAVEARRRFLIEYEAYRVPNAPKDLVPREVPDRPAQPQAAASRAPRRSAGAFGQAKSSS